ncbi:hypothetical protein N0V90_006811 [Kalmusia sp. IMI 367209]|nr:hypothetical protein N0V90_006811 [Kalmusia sp. IMI 367209]
MYFVRNSAITVALFAAIYQFWFKGFVFDVLGVGRSVESIEDFPWNCRRVTHSQLEGCEDLFLDEEDRVLYAACSGSLARSQWNPGYDNPEDIADAFDDEVDRETRLSKYNVSGRRLQGSELMAIYIDEPTSDDQFRMYSIKPRGYKGATGDITMDLVGFDVDASKKDKLDFWLINHRPPVDDKKQYLDATKIGSNVSIEVFSYSKGTLEMRHMKTISHPQIYAANNLALTSNGGFVRKEFDLILGGGNLVHFKADQTFLAATPNSLPFANGLARGHDGLIYVPFSAATYIGVYRLAQDGSLEEVTRVKVGMSVDNLSVDSSGNIWAAGIPRVLELMGATVEPFDKTSPSTIFRIRKTGEEEYEIDKVLEDGQAEVVSGATTAVFDRQSERLFIGGKNTNQGLLCEIITIGGVPS